MDAGDMRLIRGVSQNEAEAIGIVAEPDPLGSLTEAVIHLGMSRGGDIQREPRAMLARVAGHRADGLGIGIVAVMRVVREPVVPKLPLARLCAVGAPQIVFGGHSLGIGGLKHPLRLHRDLRLYPCAGIVIRAERAQIALRVYEVVRDEIIGKEMHEIDKARLLPVGEITARGDGLRLGSRHGRPLSGPRSARGGRSTRRLRRGSLRAGSGGRFGRCGGAVSAARSRADCGRRSGSRAFRCKRILRRKLRRRFTGRIRRGLPGRGGGKSRILPGRSPGARDGGHSGIERLGKFAQPAPGKREKERQSHYKGGEPRCGFQLLFHSFFFFLGGSWESLCSKRSLRVSVGILVG